MGLHQDVDRWLEKIVPHESMNQDRHDNTDEVITDVHSTPEPAKLQRW